MRDGGFRNDEVCLTLSASNFRPSTPNQEKSRRAFRKLCSSLSMQLMKTPKLLCALALSLLATSTSQSATIGSTVWNDINRNGIQDTNEPGLTNITLQLFDCSTTGLVTSVQTTNGGGFNFEGTFPSNVFLRVVLPSGFLITTRDAGADDALDSDFDPITGSTHCFTINCTNATSSDCIQTNWGVGLFQVLPCARGPGYWKTHPGAWPETNVVIAGTNYFSTNAWNLMANGADKSLTLFRQVLAARLNELAGNDVSCITQELADAEMWLEEFPRGSNVRGSSEAWQLAAPIAERLEAYNEGRLCAQGCSDDSENGNGTVTPPGNANGRLNKIRKRQATPNVFIIQQSINMTNWTDVSTVTNLTSVTDFFDDFTPGTNLVYRVVTIPREGAEPLNVFNTQTRTGNSGETELLPIVYEGDLLVRGSRNDVTGSEDGTTVITGNLVITGNNNEVRNLTVLGRVIIRGNRNTLNNVEHEGDVENSGRLNRF